MENIIRIAIVNGNSKAVRYDEQTTVERVLHVVLNGIGIGEVAHSHFALRLATSSGNDSGWLHPNLLVRHISFLYGGAFDSKLELRFRFIPQSAYELLLTESRAFLYLHDQVFDDFQRHIAWKVPLDSALELAALRVSRDYIEKQTMHCLESKIDFDSIDAESVISKFVPEAVLLKAELKPAQLKRQFIHLLKKFSALSTAESVLRSLSLLAEIIKFDVEIFKASIGAGWTSPVDLLVGPEVAISYRINERCDMSRLAELRCVLEIVVRKIEPQCEKAIVQLRLSGSAQPMLITTPSMEIAESLAHLIDGYQRMYNQSYSVYLMHGLERDESLELRHTNKANPPKVTNDSFLRLRREYVTLKELIGGGQFGNVYRGTYAPPNQTPQAVAIKVSKAENEPADAQLILQESHLMQRFCHENIVSLIGICSDSPIWLVIELAAFGELRQYLIANKASLDVQTLLLFCSQVSSALEYLHSMQFVHRDIAARNVLVCKPNLVKLTDFGLSRALDFDAVYTASRGKLPMKWMAPESLNFREFSMASDVWMFGVCAWEILSWGVKPWSGISNAEVIGEIENGKRPPKPEICPRALYNYIKEQIWAFVPIKRPFMDETTKIIRDVIEQLKRRVHPDHVRIVRTTNNIPVIRTNIESLPNLTLWRTIEDQKREMEENDKWLHEQEHPDDCDDDDDGGGGKRQTSMFSRLMDENLNQAASSMTLADLRLNNGSAQSSRSNLHDSSKSLPCGIPRPSALEDAFRAAAAVCELSAKLQLAFNQNMGQDDFVAAIKAITEQLRQMFTDVAALVDDCAAEKRHEVEKHEALLSNDMKQMSRAMVALADQTAMTAYNAHRRDVVRIAADLAFNCQSFIKLLAAPGEGVNSLGTIPFSDC